MRTRTKLLAISMIVAGSSCLSAAHAQMPQPGSTAPGNGAPPTAGSQPAPVPTVTPPGSVAGASGPVPERVAPAISGGTNAGPGAATPFSSTPPATQGASPNLSK